MLVARFFRPVAVRVAPNSPPEVGEGPRVLPAANRMRSSGDFAAAIRRGRRAGRQTLVVHYRAVTASTVPGGGGPAAPAPRVGLVVSRAVGNAVVRNRVKRRIRHLMADRLTRLAPGSLLVVRANPASAEMSDHLDRDLDSALLTVTKPVPA